jgi:hypothetical protein
MIVRSNSYSCCVILYHKTILNIYKKEWVLKCLHSIENQTFTKFDVLELNYGDDALFLEDILNTKFNFPNKHIKTSKALKNHVWAMNYLLDIAFKTLDYDFLFNVNLDDFYEHARFQKQICYLNTGYIDVVSCNMDYIEDVNGVDQLVGEGYQPDKLSCFNGSIKKELEADNNVIAHPAVVFTKNFYLTHGPYCDMIPREDLILWKKAARAGARFYIVSETLLHYRIHKNRVCNINKNST